MANQARDPGSEPQVERLREAGLRVTGPRLAILSILERQWEHPTAEAVHKTLRASYPSLSLSTVYLTLEAFIRRGLCRRVQGVDGRLRVDGTVHAHAHDHAVCRSCGRIFDVARDVFPLPTPPKELPDGLAVSEVRLQYDVICGACHDGH